MSIEERILEPISDAELERRWSAVRAAMEAERLDVLLIRAANDYLGGYVRWFTDVPAAAGYPVMLVFPKDGGMTWISQVEFGLDRRLSGTDLPFRGVVRMLGAPGYASASFTAAYELDALEAALAPLSAASLGIVGPANFPYMLADRLRAQRYSLRDASELVDVVKMRKSDEEIEAIRRTAAMQDACMEEVLLSVRPGMRDIDVGAVAERTARSRGSEQGVYLVASAPIGTGSPYGIQHYQGRVIEEGDYVTVLVENNGAAGFYTELGRTFVLGQASDEMKQDMEFVLRAQDHVASLLVPGTPCRDVWGAYGRYLEENRRPPERRLFCHGQGYDLVERPLMRQDETLAVTASMNVACHPTFAAAGNFATSCDNWLVGGAGAERLHRFPRGLVELG